MCAPGRCLPTQPPPQCCCNHRQINRRRAEPSPGALPCCCRSIEFRLRLPGVDLWTTHKPLGAEVCLMFMLLGAGAGGQPQSTHLVQWLGSVAGHAPQMPLSGSAAAAAAAACVLTTHVGCSPATSCSCPPAAAVYLHDVDDVLMQLGLNPDAFLGAHPVPRCCMFCVWCQCFTCQAAGMHPTASTRPAACWHFSAHAGWGCRGGCSACPLS